jgi:RimJ/RimL family protein N-acetyltransferase
MLEVRPGAAPNRRMVAVMPISANAITVCTDIHPATAMTAPIELPSTPRLRLRRFTLDDLDLHHALMSDPDVTRFVGGVRTREETNEAFLSRILPYYEEHPGLGAWATIARESGECIGTHLLNYIQGETYIQVGYILFKPWWGRGYATEMATALLRYGFAQLRLPTINAITDLPNTASQHVLLKSGLRRNGERSFAHPRYAGGVYAWFERDAADWLAEDPESRADAAVLPKPGTIPA